MVCWELLDSGVHVFTFDCPPKHRCRLSVSPSEDPPQQDNGTHCNAHTFWDWLEEHAKESKAWMWPPNSSYPNTIEHSFEARQQRPQSKKYHIRQIYYIEGLTSKIFNTFYVNTFNAI